MAKVDSIIEINIDDTKLRQKIQSVLCEHEYEELHSETHTFYTDGMDCKVHVKAVFYCRKCLDIQQREIALNGQA